MHVEVGLNKPYWIQGQSENWMAVVRLSGQAGCG